ncbi:kelch motif protein (macronuclear) [Tetrahymena thermophila SB210]|uniref:Kelch motif protein n=1 Tax=Tetrahymena thermophila (strain SB210) TaxID=312017 RepID=I7MEN3_TETTS|nr:kelch motif protein [Tetrahymena thermophila SB210]EAR97248.1 kelch motif protein [Tetrahymena thermophila SB210]|eukprot:XP_001017493.1 kelch motif protein [Tetrahymena thermophila SB210]
MDFLSEENLKKYKFEISQSDDQKKSGDKTQPQFGKSKSKIGFNQVNFDPISGYQTKDDMLSIEQLDSLALFMRNHSLNNSQKYPFYNNYDERNIGIHKAIIYKTILEGNRYNSTNIGIEQNSSDGASRIQPESFEEQLNRKMKYISKTNILQDIPNSLDIIGSTKSQKVKTFTNLDQDGEFEYDLDEQDLREQDQYIQENDENYIQSLIDPFNEDDYDLARINNKIFDDNCWYKKDFRMNQIKDPHLYNEKRQYYDNKRIVKRQNKEHLIYFIQTEVVLNKYANLMPHADNVKAVQEIIKDQLTYNQDILPGYVINTIFKIDVERSIFKQEVLQLQLEAFGQIHLQNSEEIFICGGKANGIAQNTCMLIDFTLKKFMIKSRLHFARYDHLLLQLDDFIYIIGGQGYHGESLTQCEKYNIKSQQIFEIASLELQKNFICGTVSQLNKCLFVAGSPIIVDNYIQIQKFEPYTNFWSVINIQVNYLTLKQPKFVKLAVYDESMQKSMLYIFCQDMNKYENYCLSVNDLTTDDTRQSKESKAKQRILRNQQQQSNSQQAKLDTLGLSTINSADSQINFYSSIQNGQFRSPRSNKNSNIFIQDQTNDQEQQTNSQFFKLKQTKSVSMIPQVKIPTPRMNPMIYLPQFNEQVKYIYKNRKQYHEQLKQKLEHEKRQILGYQNLDTENSNDTLQLSKNQSNTSKQNPTMAPYRSPSQFLGQQPSPRQRSASKLLLTPKNQENFTKSIFFDEQKYQQNSNTIFEDSPKNKTPRSRTSKNNTPKYRPPEEQTNPYYYLTKSQQQKRILEDLKKERQKLLLIEQQKPKKQKGQVVNIEQQKSNFNNLEILAMRDYEVYTINKTNPLLIEKFDFITWQKEDILLRYSPIL